MHTFLENVLGINSPVPGSGVVGGAGVVTRPPIYNEEPSGLVSLIVVSGTRVVVVVVDCTRRRPLLKVVRLADPLPSLLPLMRFNFDDEFSRLREREGFLGTFGLATSLMPSLYGNKYKLFGDKRTF